MVEIFRTNVNNDTDAFDIISLIQKKYSTYKVNFDLDDCDKILRIENMAGEDISCGELMALVVELGYQIEILPE